MGTIGKVIVGVLSMALAAPFVIKTQWFMENFGVVAWAEEKLGSGGSWLFYKLIGIGIFVIGMLWATGLLGSIAVGLLGRFFGAA